MSLTAHCPSCGASVAFRSSISILAVCEYCRTTLLDVNGKIENLGKMAELAQDRSRLQIGAQGVYRQKPFTVIGRIQLQYEQGLWNEWFLLFDNQQTGWLSEAGGTYSLSFQHSLTTSSPAFSELQPGHRLRLNNVAWTVTNIERATCVAGEGELPFKVGGGYPAPVVDLRSDVENAFVTLDYSEDEKKPLLFIGETVDFSSLKLRNLREDSPIPATPTLQARALLCQKCGAPLDLKHEGILSIGCAHCGSVTDPETGKLISEINRSTKVAPLIPIGSIGVFRGEKLEVIGFMQRYLVSEGERYFWREYLLARVDSPGYRWLIEYDKHWSVADVLEKDIPVMKPNGLQYRGETFKRFQNYKGIVDYVIGEFTWRVEIAEKAILTDYIAPPFLLSQEKTDNEISWSLSEYVPFQEIATAFKNKRLRAPVGVYANQPNPWKNKSRSQWRLFFGLALLAIVLQMIFSWSSHFQEKEYLNYWTPLKYQAASGNSGLSSPFRLDKASTLKVESSTEKLDNDWVEIGLALVRESDGEARYGSVELSHYSGWDVEDGSWSENKLKHTMTFRDVPPGDWRLLVEGIDSSNEFLVRIGLGYPVSLTVKSHHAPWENLLILLCGLLVWPAVLSFKYRRFERDRWEESDYPNLSPAEDD